MFLADQGRDAVIVRRIVTLQKFPLIGPPSSIGEVFLGPFYYYLIAPFLWIFQQNPVGLAVGVALISMGGVYLIYKLLEKHISKEALTLTILFISVSALCVDIGRFSWNPNPLPYFSFITLILFYHSLQKNTSRWMMLVFGIVFGLTFQLHHLGALLALPIGIYFIYHLYRSRTGEAWVVPAISLLGFLITLTPFAVFELRHNFLNIHNLVSLFTQQNLVSSGPFFSRLADVITAVVRFGLHVTVPPLVAWCGMALLVGWVFVYNKQKKNQFITLQLITFVSLLIGLSRVNAQSIPHYFHTLYLSFYFLLAVFLDSILEKKGWYRGIAIVLIGIFCVIQSSSYTFLWSAPNRQNALPERIGAQIAAAAQGERINLATYPTDFTSRDCYQYYIEINGGNVVDGSSSEVATTLYVLCDKEPCNILTTHSWNIQMFGTARIDTMWNTDGVQVYKLVHN